MSSWQGYRHSGSFLMRVDRKGSTNTRPYISHIYTISTVYLHNGYIYIYIYMCDIYMISTKYLHMCSYIVFIWNILYDYTYYINYACIIWQCVKYLHSYLNNSLQCASAAVPWRAACINLVSVCDVYMHWFIVCHYVQFWNIMSLVCQLWCLLALRVSL